jgi:hypothetical protein
VNGIVACLAMMQAEYIAGHSLARG